MSRSCSICLHANRNEIDGALVAGSSFRNVAEQFGVSTTSVFRHRNGHLPAHLSRAREAEVMSDAEGLLSKIAGLEVEARRIASRAESEGDLRTALAGVRELTRIVELLARLRGELNETTSVNILVLPEWQRIRTVMHHALASFPEAKIAVARALKALDVDRG